LTCRRIGVDGGRVFVDDHVTASALLPNLADACLNLERLFTAAADRHRLAALPSGSKVDARVALAQTFASWQAIEA